MQTKNNFINLFNPLMVILFIYLFMTSCEKIDRDLVGEWKLSETSYSITANQDFIFYDPFKSPWQGTIIIDDEEYDVSSFIYYYDNAFGSTQFISEDLRFTFFGPYLHIELKDGDGYVIDSYEFNISKGEFNAEGIATNDNKSIQVNVETHMPNIPMKKGEELWVRGAFFSIVPYLTLNLQTKGKLLVDYLMGDIAENLSGNWSVDNNQITISTEKFSSNTYQYNLNGVTIYLIKSKIEGKDAPSNISPFADKINNIKYQAKYTVY